MVDNHRMDPRDDMKPVHLAMQSEVVLRCIAGENHSRLFFCTRHVPPSISQSGHAKKKDLLDVM